MWISPKAPDLATWDRPDGPMIVPGSYTVHLKVDGEEFSANWELLADPRIATPPTDLVSQRDFLLGVLEALGRTNATIDRIDTLRTQLDIWSDRIDESTMASQIETIQGELNDIRGQLIDVNMRGSQLWPSGLHEKFNALLDSADGADYAPPKQAFEVTEQLKGQLIGLLAWLEDIESEGLATLNKSIVASGQPPVGARART